MDKKIFGQIPLRLIGVPSATVKPTDVPLSLRRAGSNPEPSLSSLCKMPHQPVQLYGGQRVTEIVFRVSGLSSNDPTIPNPSKGHLLAVHMIGDTSVILRFLDGFCAELNLHTLGLNVSELRIGTIRASAWGGAAEIEDSAFHTIHIDSSVLRAKVDPEYAAVLKQAIADLKQP